MDPTWDLWKAHSTTLPGNPRAKETSMHTPNPFKPTLQCLLQMFLVSILSLGAVAMAQDSEYENLKQKAETYYDRGSYAKAHASYLQAQKSKVPEKDTRWLKFKIADSLWRSQASTRRPDNTLEEKARGGLEVLIRDIKREEDKDRLWVEVKESLGDYWWMRKHSKNWGQAWPHYQQALDWWAGAQDIELARTRYLGMVWKVASPSWREPYYYYGYYGNSLPVDILENVVKIAQTENDKARAHYLLAMSLRHQGGWDAQKRVSESFETALEMGKDNDWYDDALFHYAEWLARYGPVRILENGQTVREPDFNRAVEMFRRLTREFRKGETRYYDQARRQAESIVSPVLAVRVSNFFLPESTIKFHLNWRNIPNITLTLFEIDLTDDISFRNKNRDWFQNVNPNRLKKVKSWNFDTHDEGDHHPGQSEEELEEELPIGAYILQVTGGGQKAQDLVLVTDSSLVVKTSPDQALVYFCDSQDGAPIANARVFLAESYYHGRHWRWRDHESTTNDEGMAVFKLKSDSRNRRFFAAANHKGRQAFATIHGYGSLSKNSHWKIYAHTDRPAYRPEETLHWKMTARIYDGTVYNTPGNEKVEYEITDPRGSKVDTGTVNLNAFGSAWGELELSKSMPLGTYRITFWNKGRKDHLGSASLFQLEEYKLPEFKVSVSTPEENGRQKTFRLGEEVEIEIQADYFFGGPVGKANVEVVIYQKPYYHYWHPTPDFPWFFDEGIHPRPRYYGRGQQVKREVLKTDAQGKATLKLQTPANNGQDLEYEIEARVTDASRREITARSTVKVTSKPYYVYMNPEHYLHQPQDKVQINIRSLDANSQPVQVEGKVRLTRDVWIEVWVDPSGKEISGPELRTFKDSAKIFPPPPPTPGGPSWHLKFQGYEHDEIFTQTLKTDEKGEAEFTFTPEREGYYRVAWTSQVEEAPPVQSETTVWVATNATTALGYHHGGLELVVDKESFHAGQKAPVMIMVPSNDRYVLFSVEADDLYSYRLVHLKGTVKLVQLDITEKHVPNIFLNGYMVSNHKIFQAQKQIIVPPVKNFLDVEVSSDQENYQPREEGTFTVTAKNHEGEPVSAELALGLVDESVYSIHEEFAQDPRQFFYGDKRGQRVYSKSSFQEKVLLKTEKKDKIEGGFGNEAFKKGMLGGAVGFGSRAKELRARSGDKAMLQAAPPMSASAPAPAMEAEFMDMDMAVAEESAGAFAGADGEAGASGEVIVRSDFRTTVFWRSNIETGKDGKAEVKVRFPDSLTQWRATARAVTRVNQFGIDTQETRTRQPLIARLQAPRFFVVGDSVTISGVFNNNTESALEVIPKLGAAGVTVDSRWSVSNKDHRKGDQIEVPPHSETRVDWQVKVEVPGEAKLKLTGLGQRYSDAMEKSYIVHDHGIEKLIAQSGKARNKETSIHLSIPAERNIESTDLVVQIAPSMATTLLDALPYLIDYPYGCTEQTMSRFLPSIITARTLANLDFPKEEVMGRMFGGIEAQYSELTHPKGKQDMEKLDDMVAESLERLYDFQQADGGWGWWKEGDGDPFMTAYVMWGLLLAKSAGEDIDMGTVDEANRFLDKALIEEELQFDRQAWILHALSEAHVRMKTNSVSRFQKKAFDNLWTHRDKLNAYTRALFALSAQNYGFKDKAKLLIENLENGVKWDDTPDTSIVQRGEQQSSAQTMKTAHWGEDGIYWRWSQGGVEATAFALKALLAIDPKNALVEPVMNWLVKNRRGAQWSNTRDTAIVVLALNDYLSVSGELASEVEYQLIVNGHSVATQRVTPQTVLSAPGTFRVPQKWIINGDNEIKIVKTSGDAPLYFSAQAKFFSREEPVTAAGNEIFLRRQYYKQVGRPTLLKGYVYDFEPLNDGDSIQSGERVEAVITIESKNNLEYLLFEDLKPAGFEAVAILSGQNVYAKELKSGSADALFRNDPNIKKIAGGELESQDFTGRQRWVYQELRDRQVALFIDKLPEGYWQLRYSLRAEVPGEFHALSVLGHAMYVPEIKANGQEIRITVKDRPLQ